MSRGKMHLAHFFLVDSFEPGQGARVAPFWPREPRPGAWKKNPGSSHLGTARPRALRPREPDPLLQTQNLPKAQPVQGLSPPYGSPPSSSAGHSSHADIFRFVFPSSRLRSNPLGFYCGQSCAEKPEQ
jgi:hypothetical protein